jgi:hypothetical protein
MTDDEPETSLTLMTLALAGIGIGIMVLIFAARPAEGATVCLTHKEARQLWPTRHLWWYGPRHGGSGKCWSNRRYGPPRGLKFDPVDPVFPKRAMAKVPNEPQAADTDNCCWPQLDRDANANVIEPPRSFIDRWQDQPWLGRIGQ